MRIYTRVVMVWDGTRYSDAQSEAYMYVGPVASCCGASTAQTNIQNEQSAAYATMTQQASQVFGQDSAVFSDLMSTFAPTIAAGPNQQGFSAPELSNLNSQAITETGQAYKNAKEAVGEAESAQGGGNTGLTSGAQTATDLSVAEGAAQQSANELGQITQADYSTGRQNYENATAGLLGATNSFNSSTSANNATTGSGEAAANTANQIASQNNSWMQAVTGALGGVAGGVITGGMSNLGKGTGFFGGGSGGGEDDGSD